MFGCRFGGGFGGFGGRSFGLANLGPWIFLIMAIRIIIIIAIIVLVVKLIKGYSRGNNKALEILNQKFASGEISEEEYLNRKNILKQK